jgi:hypothetical protein
MKKLQKRIDHVLAKYGIKITGEMAIEAYKSGMGASSVGYNLFLAKGQKESITIGDVAIDYGQLLTEQNL